MQTGASDVFEASAVEYDSWYDRHSALYAAELKAVGSMVDRGPGAAPALEVGVGGGRFAGPLGIGFGVDRAPRMAALARTRGCRTVVADAGRLPFADGTFGWTAFLTVLCFLADPLQALQEAHRVTRPGGSVIVAFLNRTSEQGRTLEAGRAGDRYFASASFFSPDELEQVLLRAGFVLEDACQVLESAPGGGSFEVVPGSDRGLYCVVRARRVGRNG